MACYRDNFTFFFYHSLRISFYLSLSFQEGQVKSGVHELNIFYVKSGTRVFVCSGFTLYSHGTSCSFRCHVKEIICFSAPKYGLDLLHRVVFKGQLEAVLRAACSLQILSLYSRIFFYLRMTLNSVQRHFFKTLMVVEVQGRAEARSIISF
jgi:hypothetical protein